MAIFLTGATGYVGAHVAALLLENHRDQLNLLVRAKNQQEGAERLWKSLQLHLDFPRFYEYLQTRVNIFCGDLTDARFGLSDDDYRRLSETTDSVIHCAASLNRKSEKVCLNVNLRGTLEVIKLAQAARDLHGLRRFSDVSTVAICGHRFNEVVTEDAARDWSRSDYDPYARTKKFCEHMVEELLPDVQHTVFRPSIILGDSRYAETTQFDMVRSFVFLAGLPVLPFRPTDKIDIVNVDFVAESIVTIHQKEKPNHDIYHLSSGVGSQTFRELTDALSQVQSKSGPLYLPALEKPFTTINNWLADNLRGNAIGFGATLLKVFIPYLVWNTVFDNTRITNETGKKPAPFSAYSYPLLKFSKVGNFTYPYRSWPADVRQAAASAALAGA
ncbi:MAG: SDR family oxidoreductase [Acidobacteria bacterium]|nr:SDR family oxidoreductase [Acidobacteriota bacterium]